MRKTLIRVLAVCALGCVSALPSAFAQQRSEPLTNAAVIKLVRAGFKEKTVIAVIHSRQNRFDLAPDRLIELKRNGVSENIILAMLTQDESAIAAGDDWGDDSFFRGGQKPTDEKNNDKPQAGADIFGSNGSSRGQTRGRGRSGSSEGDTVTTGSATVRILKPPSEGGGGPTKLEKTPTLDNESIVKLVDAGFSEGTIIKRIEDSPVEFDLSAPKLAELRKHRVSEPVIAAMQEAMKDDSSSKTSTPGRPKEN